MLPGVTSLLDATPVPDPASASGAREDAANLSAALRMCNADKTAARGWYLAIARRYAQ